MKFHCVKETHDINSLLTLVKIVQVSQHKKQQPNKSLSRFVEYTDSSSDLKVHALHYANELLVLTRTASDLPFKNFCKLAKQAETIRNSANRDFGYD